MTRKEERLKNKWNVTNVYTKIQKKKITELKMTASSREQLERHNERERRQTGNAWKELKDIRGKTIYRQLVNVRYGKHRPEEKERVNHAMSTIARKLTPEQRQFWWKVAHRKHMTNDRAHKWKVDERGRAHTNCPVCRHENETWNHYDMIVMDSRDGCRD